MRLLDRLTVFAGCALLGAAVGALTAPPSAKWWATWVSVGLLVVGRVVWKAYNNGEPNVG